MDLRHLRFFVAVVDEGGVSRAAAVLFIAQPSLSQVIRQLEDEVGVQLFDRTPTGMRLTEAGRRFEPAARAVLADAEAARTRAREVREVRAGRLTISATPTLVVEPLTGLVARMRELYPEVRVDVFDGGIALEAWAAVRDGLVELAVTDLRDVPDSLVAVPVTDQRLVLGLTAELAAGLPDPLPLARLPEVPLIVEPGGEVDRGVYGSGLNVVVRSAVRATTWDLVTAGVGAALLPDTFLANHLPQAQQLGLDPPVQRTVGLVLRRGPQSPAAAAFIALARRRRRDPGDH
ncbi:LysR family transcriptional regulator [Granulicoccus phenolivorans]|uniref:LysR family transcriptional regulator n=1 Tax=Granulicoccus phenolivorans TaxID=266854 RepID=UPI0003F6F291|nr:LysR family transcriptional regulator [Granulicoccus phenolivorans]